MLIILVNYSTLVLRFVIMYLNCKTYFSLRYGTFATDELVKTAATLGVTSLALTNINSTADAWEFVKCCHAEKIKPVLGAEIRNGDKLLYILIAANNKGFSWINQFLSIHLTEKKEFPEASVSDPFFTDIWDGYVIYPVNTKSPLKLFPNEFIGITLYELTKLYGVPTLFVNEKYVIRQPVTFQSKGYHNLHTLLRAVDHNVLLSKLPATAVCSIHDYFISPGKLFHAFREYPSIVANTCKLMDSCRIDMDYKTDKTKKTFTGSAEGDRLLLEKLAFEGMISRYGSNNTEAKSRIEKELLIITNLGFNAYFLITWDIVCCGQNRGYYHIGRGSGANSIVAYCIQITDVDPIALDLFFERFLNPHRTSPPDFDIDFSWADRDDMTEYIFNRYDKNHVALLGVFARFKHSSIVQELGKVFGMPERERKEMSESDPSIKYAKGTLNHTISQYGRFMQNFPNYIGIHAGGILISEQPLFDYTALYMPPKGFPTTQIDMYYADDIGLYKLDVLSQRGLGHIKDSIDYVKQNKRISINIHEVQKFKEDDKLNNQLSVGNTIGCFYIESPAMRHVIQKLKCNDYETLVAASSIIRPGIGRSGMMREYILRHNNPKNYKSLHPKLAEILKSTYEVMVYQEDMIRVGHEWAELTMAEADMMRRATSFKYRVKDQMGYLKIKFFENGKRLKYPDEVVAEVWRQIESFAEFSFCKAHSASFAVESYQSLFLKTYFPREFMVGVINNFGGFYGQELYFYELMKAGASVHPPCINNSDYLTNINSTTVFVGFIHIDSFKEKTAKQIVEERKTNGNYLHLQNFIERTGISIIQLNLLIRVGAFRFTGKNKKELLWEARYLQSKITGRLPVVQSLFPEDPKSFKLPELSMYEMDDCYDEIQLLGFPVCNPFEIVDDDPRKYKLAKDMKNHVGQAITFLGYHITHKPVHTIHGDMMSFGTFLDINSDWIDTVHFPEVHRRLPPKVGFYYILGKVVEDFGVYSVEVINLEKAGIKGREHLRIAL
ncbi:MAG: DNA polymerase III subunit alpha [Bacteroidota bacterium]